MRSLAIALCVTLAGCGVETASTAATGAVIKKQEIEQGKKTMEQAQQRIGQALDAQQQAQQRQSSEAEK
jgi:hypothetical protein